jgi:hypothetical protein
MEFEMGPEVIYDSPHATLWYYPESKIIHHKIYNNLIDDEFKTFIGLASRTLAEKGATKWLSEDQSLLLIGKDKSDFSGITWPQKNIENGWKYWAIVQPKNIVTQINMEKMVKYFNSLGVTAKFFTEVEEAKKWLESL